MKKFYVALVCFFVAGALEAQPSPGGVGSANVAMWLKPDGLAAGPLATWIYANNGANQFTSPSGSQPTVTANGLNFWPTINFNGSQYMTGPSGPGGAPIPAGQLNYAIFAVWNSPTAVGGANMRVWSQRQTGSGANYDGAALWVYPGGANTTGQSYSTSGPTYGDQPEVAPYITGVAYPITTSPLAWSNSTTTSQSILTYAPNTTYISSMNLLNAATNDLELMDQSNYGVTPAVTSTDPAGIANGGAGHRVITDQENVLGIRYVGGDEPFTGNLSELIVLNTNVTAAQRQQIFSYLALKYGLPLNGNYYSSASTTTPIWDATAGGGTYNNFVFGLGEDDASGLLLTQSNSMSTSGMSNAANITLSNASAQANGGFVMVGSNNAGTAETQSNVPTVAAGSWRMQNQWLVQNTGSVGTVDVAVDLTGVSLASSGSTVGTSTDFRLVTDNDGDGDFTTGTQSYYTPTSWSNTSVANFTGVNLAMAPTVAFAVLTGATGATPLPVNWVSFTAVPSGANVNLNWTVGANEQAKVYQVQRSVDGTHFAQVGEVNNDATVKSYSYVDAGVGAGVYYYRVLEIDRDGESIYSKIVTVNMNGGGFSLKLLNNPTITSNTDPELQVTTNVSGNVLMEVWTLSGSKVGSFQQAIGEGTTTLRVPMSGLSAGTYALKVTANNSTQTLQVVKL